MRVSVKSFGQFLTEAVKTAASTEAKMKGLKGDGHGGWYDAKGNFVAKTVNGKLQFTGGRGAAAPEDPKSTKVATPDPKSVQKKAPMPVAGAPQPNKQRLKEKESHQSQEMLRNRLLKLWELHHLSLW